MKKLVALMAGMMLMIGMTATAQALTLTLEQGSNIVSVTDGSAIDTKTTTGIIGWSGTLGTFDLDISTTGYSQPVFGSSTLAYMDLLAGALTSASGGGTLKITLADTNFNLDLMPGISPNAEALASIGGTISGLGSVTYNTYYNGTLLTSVSGLTGTSFQSDEYKLLDVVNPFALSLELLITHEGAANTTFDSKLEVIPTPEPGTIVLLGAGLLGLGIYGRRRAKK